MAKNKTSSGFTAIQVGTVGGKAPKPAKGAKAAKPDAKDAPTTNQCTGNATVGVQTDTVVGDITISF